MVAITDQDGNVAQVDSFTGALLVTGAGAEPAATALRIQDGVVAGQYAAVDANGQLLVKLPSGFATETTLVQVRDFLDTVETLLGQRATETTLEALRAAFVAEDFATQTTLASVLASVDGLEAKDYATQATLAAILAELLRRPVDKIVAGEVSVPNGNTFITIVEVTPSVATTVLGFNADFSSLMDTRYRLRLITGTDAAPTVQVTEQVSTDVNSWVPVRLSCAANVRTAVQVVHGEVVAQTVRASLNYREEP